MNILQKMLGKSFRFLSIGIVIVMIMAMITAPVAAATPTGPFTLEYFPGDYGYLTGETSQIVELGGNGTAVEVIPYTGYHFVDWSDYSTANPRTDTNVTDNIYVTANYAINTYTLNYYAGTGGTLTGDTSQTVDYGADGTAVTAVADTNYHFVDWSDGSMDNPRTDYGVDGDIDVMANFAIDAFTLDYETDGNGWLSGETSQTVDYGGSGTAVEAIPYTGYHFVNWSDDLTDNPRTDTYVTADIYVTANFTIDTYTLTYTAGANGTLSGETTQTVEYEADGTAVTAIADTGYRFVSWSDGSTDNPRTDYDITSDINVTANFAFLYTVSFNSQGGSAVPDQLVVSGGMVDYPVAPSKTGLYFAGWYKEASCDNVWHTRTDLVSSNVTLYARWNETAPKVAILYRSSSYNNDILAKLVSTGLFSQIDLISLSNETPSTSILKQYHAVMLYSDMSNIPNPDAWGNVLADYVDYGGGVVFTAFTFGVPDGSVGVDGRINADGYLPFIWDSYSHSDYRLTLVEDAAADPILNGVNHVNGGTSSFHCSVSLASDANLIAHWSNDVPLVATKQLTDKGRIVGLNFYPPSSDFRSDLWDSTTDGALLMANSLLWAASTGAVISPPTITSDGGDDTAYVNAEENQTAVTTVTATDPDSTTLTYSISGGIDSALFTIDPSTGVLTFKTAPNFENPADYYGKNIYIVTVQVSDSELTDAQEIHVTVTNVNDAPVITSNGGGATASVSAKEEQTAVTIMTATDPDSDTLTYSISGGSDADLFAIDSSTGVLTFKAAPDFETPADNNYDGIYEVSVEVSDGTLTDIQAISVTVTLLTPVDLLNALKSDIRMLESEGKLSSSTANGLVRNIDKAIAKINAGDYDGAIKLLTSTKTTINRQTPRKIASSDATDLVAQIDLVITRLMG